MQFVVDVVQRCNLNSNQVISLSAQYKTELSHFKLTLARVNLQKLL